MADPRMTKLAELLVNYSVEIKPGDWVMVRGDVAAEPLVAEVVRQVVRAGGKPTVLLNSDAIEEAFLREASPKILGWVSPVNEMLYEQADVLMALRATSNTRALTGIDPQKERIRAVANRGLTETYMRRSAAKELRWVGTQYPCPAYAQEADMSLSEYEDFVYAATFCDCDDPVAEWKRVHDEQQKIVDWLAGRKIVTVKSPNAEDRKSVV